MNRLLKRETLMMTGSDVRRLLTMKMSIAAVESVFREKLQGQAQLLKAFLAFEDYGGDVGCLASYVAKTKVASVKVIGYNPHNVTQKLPTITATIILVDPKTSFPLAIMDGTAITAMRTGAAGAVAAKYLAKKNSSAIGLIGAGAQARTQLRGLQELFNIKSAKVWDVNDEASKLFARLLTKELSIHVEPVSRIEKAVVGSDIVITSTPSKKALVMDAWVSAGAHINAIGADEPGKQELDPRILKRAKIVVDDRQQTIHRRRNQCADKSRDTETG